MHFSNLVPLLPLISLAHATPTPSKKASPISISVDVFDDTACNLPTVRGYSFTENNACQQFIKQEGSVTATSLNEPVKPGCVLQVFADTNCGDVLAAITVDGTCQAPLLGPASSGMLVGC